MVCSKVNSVQLNLCRVLQFTQFEAQCSLCKNYDKTINTINRIQYAIKGCIKVLPIKWMNTGTKHDA